MTTGEPLPDTIAAISTPPGVGAVALVRLSGPEALAVARRVAPSLPESPEPRTAHLVRFVDPAKGEALDRGLLTFFPGPASYTGEDVVELSGHGGWVGPALLLDACRSAGAREAEAGEFTRRAYLHGKLDLVQAEAVADLIEGRSRALHGAAMGQLERGLSRRVAEAREALVHLEALLVQHLDFPDEDEAPASTEQIAGEAEALAERLGRLVATAPEGELLREGAVTVLAGRPNTGKSSLFNALVGRERAIVTEVPGTTRDALEAVVSLGGYPFRLVDTAGLRGTEDRVERLGIEVARRYLDAADLVLLCVEAGTEPGRDENAFLASVEAPVVLVRTKADLRSQGNNVAGGARRDDPEGGRAAVDGVEVAGAADGGVAGGEVVAGGVRPECRAVVRTSVETGEGLDELRTLLPGLVYRRLVEAGRTEMPVVTRARQARGLERARDEVGRFAEALRSGVPAEVAAAHLRPAETALEEVLGVITSEEVLDHLFTSFCIGK